VLQVEFVQDTVKLNGPNGAGGDVVLPTMVNASEAFAVSEKNWVTTTVSVPKTSANWRTKM
jgi:non-ribosomal peptide synthetase component E (peptide arylation enzyme)